MQETEVPQHRLMTPPQCTQSSRIRQIFCSTLIWAKSGHVFRSQMPCTFGFLVPLVCRVLDVSIGPLLCFVLFDPSGRRVLHKRPTRICQSFVQDLLVHTEPGENVHDVLAPTLSELMLSALGYFKRKSRPRFASFTAKLHFATPATHGPLPLR